VGAPVCQGDTICLAHYMRLNGAHTPHCFLTAMAVPRERRRRSEQSVTLMMTNVTCTLTMKRALAFFLYKNPLCTAFDRASWRCEDSEYINKGAVLYHSSISMPRAPLFCNFQPVLESAVRTPSKSSKRSSSPADPNACASAVHHH